MIRIREVVAYKHYFEEFLKEQPTKVQDKVFKILEAIETLEHIPGQYFKHLTNTDGQLKIWLANLTLRHH